MHVQIPTGAEVVGLGADDLEEMSDEETAYPYQASPEAEAYRDYSSLILKADHGNRCAQNINGSSSSCQAMPAGDNFKLAQSPLKTSRLGRTWFQSGYSEMGFLPNGRKHPIGLTHRHNQSSEHPVPERPAHMKVRCLVIVSSSSTWMLLSACQAKDVASCKPSELL